MSGGAGSTSRLLHLPIESIRLRQTQHFLCDETKNQLRRDRRNARQHRLAQIAVIAAIAVEKLLGTIVDTRNAEGGDIERQHVDQDLPSVWIGAETRLVVAFAHLVVIIKHGHHFVADPGM